MQAEGDFGDDAESAEGADHQLVQVVAGDVLHYFAARFGDGAVREHDGHADDEVAQAAVAQTECAGVVGGEDAADGGGSGQSGSSATCWRCLARVLWSCCQVVSGLDGAREILPGVRDDSVETSQFKVDICFGRIAPGLFCAASDRGDSEMVFVGIAENFRDLLRVGREDGYGLPRLSGRVPNR